LVHRHALTSQLTRQIALRRCAGETCGDHHRFDLDAGANGVRQQMRAIEQYGPIACASAREGAAALDEWMLSAGQADETLRHGR
jgi:hypothetical protein